MATSETFGIGFMGDEGDLLRMYAVVTKIIRIDNQMGKCWLVGLERADGKLASWFAKSQNAPVKMGDILEIDAVVEYTKTHRGLDKTVITEVEHRPYIPVFVQK